MCEGMRIPGVAALVFVLMVIFMIMLAFIMRPKGKSALRWLGVYAVIVVGYIGYVCYTCGPNPFDVKVMKPMAEAISNYIVKHGVPESLSDIPDLPYELEGCKRKSEYIKYDFSKGWKTVSKNNAEVYEINEFCTYKNIKLKLRISHRFDSNRVNGELYMSSAHYARLRVYFHLEKNNSFVFEKKIDIWADRRAIGGICSPIEH